jgi:murein DD-endopeptidase MepM/ murein hydrolase activator NlpD
MKKFYYFSKSKLKFVEIRSFYKKFVFLILFFAILASFFIFGTFIVFNEFINPDSEVKALRSTNNVLKDKFEQLSSQYKNLDNKITDLSSKSHDLRLKANLEPEQIDNNVFGTGGKIFEPIRNSTVGKINNRIEELESFINEVSLKVSLEKNNYEEIEKTLKSNEQLYESIPALKPCDGTLADDFGMRMHPILKIVRMHSGDDILTDIGTKVYAPGNGRVEFAGQRSGYGWTLEIDHGFGYRTVYAHLDEIKVKAGQKIQRGDLIALSGNSGKLSTGPHLHYEVYYQGVAVDPINFMFDDVKMFDVVKK